MKIPTSTEVNGQEWKIRRRSLKATSKGKFTYGLTMPNKKTIALNWGLTDDAIMATLLHELVHATIPDLDEEAVLRLEESLMTTLARTATGESVVWDSHKSRYARRRKYEAKPE